MRTTTKTSAQQCHVQATYFDFGDLGLNFNQGFQRVQSQRSPLEIATPTYAKLRLTNFPQCNTQTALTVHKAESMAKYGGRQGRGYDLGWTRNATKSRTSVAETVELEKVFGVPAIEEQSVSVRAQRKGFRHSTNDLIIEDDGSSSVASMSAWSGSGFVETRDPGLERGLSYMFEYWTRIHIDTSKILNHSRRELRRIWPTMVWVDLECNLKHRELNFCCWKYFPCLLAEEEIPQSSPGLSSGGRAKQLGLGRLGLGRLGSALEVGLRIFFEPRPALSQHKRGLSSPTDPHTQPRHENTILAGRNSNYLEPTMWLRSC
ncbi:hypothetical protein B0H14DRAFT_3773480 [Mycena olivaceomarginata]|nr:hypothetical protein B0H14DRAFT_3773480 [Mycena olivaceomarginata]